MLFSTLLDVRSCFTAGSPTFENQGLTKTGVPFLFVALTTPEAKS